MIRNSHKNFDVEQYSPETVIGEFSGRDSVAAIMKAFEDESINYILPIASFAGSEFGDYDVIYRNYEQTAAIVEKKYGDRKVLYPLFEFSNPKVWKLLNGRFMSVLSQKYNFYTPCIGCHLYFHLIKIPFAKMLSGRVISGERTSHDGRKKVNQLSQALDAYQSVLKSVGIELMMPVREVMDGAVVEELIGHDWEEGANHPSCILSGNYRDINGKAIFNEDAVNDFLETFLIPAGKLMASHLFYEGALNLDQLKSELQEIL